MNCRLCTINPCLADPVLRHQYLPIQVGGCQYTGVDKLEPANSGYRKIQGRRPSDPSNARYECSAAFQLDLVIFRIAAERQLSLKPF